MHCNLKLIPMSFFVFYSYLLSNERGVGGAVVELPLSTSPDGIKRREASLFSLPLSLSLYLSLCVFTLLDSFAAILRSSAESERRRQIYWMDGQC